MTKNAKARAAASACNRLVLQSALPDAHAVRAAQWAGRFDMLARYSGYLSTHMIDIHITEAHDMVPGFTAAYEELSQ